MDGFIRSSSFDSRTEDKLGATVSSVWLGGGYSSCKLASENDVDDDDNDGSRHISNLIYWLAPTCLTIHYLSTCSGPMPTHFMSSLSHFFFLHIFTSSNNWFTSDGMVLGKGQMHITHENPLCVKWFHHFHPSLNMVKMWKSNGGGMSV